MTFSIHHDRAAQLLVRSDEALSFDAAQARLETAALLVSWDRDTAQETWLQAALFALVRCGAKMFRGGVFLAPCADPPCGLALKPSTGLMGQLVGQGARLGPAPALALRVHVGLSPPPEARLVCAATGWDGVVSPRAIALDQPGNEISGVLAAAMACAEAFKMLLLGDLRSGRQERRVSAWGPDAPASPIVRLPTSLWMLGLGNLGQAALFALSLLPFRDPRAVNLLLHDHDRAGPENLPVQVLTETHWIGRRKTRACADWSEQQGFSTIIVETPLSAFTRPAVGEPRILLAGVDNLKARRLAAVAGFDLVIDAGLGAAAVDAFDFRLHAFPGERDPMAAWPEISEPSVTPSLPSALRDLVAQGRLDQCGAVTLAGKSVGVPCTALAAAALQLSQLCRALVTSGCCDRIDGGLSHGAPTTYHVMRQPLLTPLAWTESLVPAHAA